MTQQPINGIAATMFHGEGAIAQCGHCKRYTLDRKALADSRQPVCDCGKQHYWSGSFKPPGPDAQWFGPRPAADPVEQAEPHLNPNETDPGVLWAEIARLQAAVAGPDGYASWQEAATAERVRRVRAEKALEAQQAAQPVASIYITPGGEREMDDWRHPLPVGRNILYTAAPAPVAPLTDEQWLKLRTARTGQRLRRTHDERARAEFLAWMRFAEAAYGIKAGKDGAA